MNFMSYVAKVSRGWDEPNARDMGRMTSQPNAKGKCLVIATPTIPIGGTIQISLETTPPQYKQHVQALPQASSFEQAMVNLSKVVGDFVGAQKSINAQLSKRIDSVESSLIKMMDEVQNDLSQKIDNLQDSISRFANLNIVQEKENSPSQPYQNSKASMKWSLKRENLQW
ncbi:hypothetical protein CK203_059244 [Vitis vinifera]|uniref:Uncharacterized protein n=1 Tax=Vitis vinifera TaxID=29760 RepID=A0A438GEB2_VITVI|nr:hypothetical protein CK203_059244 [Vitis vinifera]